MANISHFTQTVNGVSTTYDIHDADAIPRSGGAVLNGTLFTKNDTNSSVCFRSGPYYADGASIQLKGKDQADASGGRAYITAHNGTRNTTLIIWPKIACNSLCCSRTTIFS